MPAFSHRLILLLGAAMLAGAPAAFAESGSAPAAGDSAAKPGPQNPGGRMPESGRVPDPAAQSQHSTQSDPGTPKADATHGDTSPGAKLTTH